MEQVPDLKVVSSLSVTLLCSRFRFLPVSSLVELEQVSVSSEELAVCSELKTEMGRGKERVRLGVGFSSRSTSIEGESSEEEVGGVRRADVMA